MGRPVPGTRAERRARRRVIGWFAGAVLFVAAFVAVFLGWPWRYEPVPTGVCGVLLASGFNDLLAMEFGISVNATVWIGRLGLLLLPPLAYAVTYRYCLGLADTDREVLADGIETGMVVRREHGGFVAVHQPLASVDDDGERPELHYTGTPVPKRLNDLGLSGSPVPGGLFRPDPPEETAALRRASRDDGDDRDNGDDGDDAWRRADHRSPPTA